MAYDKCLAERLRAIFADRYDRDEKEMFGGIAYRCYTDTCAVPSSTIP